MSQVSTKVYSYKNVADAFYGELIGIIEEASGEHLIEQFKMAKSYREQYLNSRWESNADETEMKTFRQIDYLDLLERLRNSSEKKATVITIHRKIAQLCIRYGKKSEAMKINTYIERLARLDTSEFLVN